jgi:tRNA dimethylallyltransferase
MRGKINIIFGATASGKTALAIKLAHELDGEVINADSMQIYAEIPIISAQPTIEEREGIPHHLFGHISVFEKYSVARFIEESTAAIKDVMSRGKTPILVGGTGMYLKALVEGMPEMPDISDETMAIVNAMTTPHAYTELQKLDRTMAEKLKPNDTQRIKRALSVIMETGVSLQSFQVGEKRALFARDKYHIIWLNPDRQVVYDKINRRFAAMVENGALMEVKRVWDIANGRAMPKAHGLYELYEYLLGNISMSEAISRTQQLSRNYAKRQLTWASNQFEFDEVL